MMIMPPALSAIDARRAAIALLDRCGDVAIAAAVLRAQDAEARGRYEEMSGWRSIAEAALEFSKYDETPSGRLSPIGWTSPKPSRFGAIAPSSSPVGWDVIR